MYTEIKTMFNNFKVNNVSIPVAHLRYTGSAKTYVLWSMNGEIPGLAADDDITYSIASVDSDIYSETDYSAIKKAVKLLFKNNSETFSQFINSNQLSMY